MNTWPHRVAAITGASSGIGRHMAIEIARRGSDVALLTRRKDALEETAAAVRGEGRRAAVVPCDVRDREAVLAAIREVESALGPVDLLIANAGIRLPVPARKSDGRRVAEVLAVNVAGPAHAIEAVLPGMLERRSGRIVGISRSRRVARLRGAQHLPAAARPPSRSCSRAFASNCAPPGWG